MSENNTSVTSEHEVGAAAKARPGGVMLTVYRWALLVFLAAGVVQIFLAGLGAFKLLHGPAIRRWIRTGRWATRWPERRSSS